MALAEVWRIVLKPHVDRGSACRYQNHKEHVEEPESFKLGSIPQGDSFRIGNPTALHLSRYCVVLLSFLT